MAGYLDPEQIARINTTQIPGLEEQQADLADQLAQAEALGKAGRQQFGGLGQGFQSLADIINAYNSQRKQKDVRGKMDANRDKRMGYVKDWRTQYELTNPFGMGGQEQLPPPPQQIGYTPGVA